MNWVKILLRIVFPWSFIHSYVHKLTGSNIKAIIACALAIWIWIVPYTNFSKSLESVAVFELNQECEKLQAEVKEKTLDLRKMEKEKDKLAKQVTKNETAATVKPAVTEVKTTTKPVKTTVKPTAKPKKAVTNEEYEIFKTTVAVQLTQHFENISTHAGNNSMRGVKGEIDKMNALKKTVQQQETPKKYKDFQTGIVEIVECWNLAYAELTKNNAVGVGIHTENANKILSELVKKYG